MRWWLRTVGLAMLVLAAQPAWAGDGDHDRARRAVAAGEARPLAEILAKVKDRLPGEVAGIEFERRHGRWIYEFKTVNPQGRKQDVYVDALTAEILRVKDKS